ncbi:MAG: o-succinylbenzoate synthase [Actinomycetota bacterium]|nr:o-succinylbenzoate synthase [Actinomycetota bacterium]
MTLPPLDALLDGMRVVSLPLRLRFRGVEHREAVLVQGPAGWGEFAPFLEYDRAESSRWLAAAVEAAWVGFPEPVRQEVPVNATLPAVPPGQVADVLARYDGCRTVKVKVAERGQSLADDVDRVAAVRDVVGADVRIRVDANGGWDVDQALAAIGALAAHGLEYAEQPCPRVEDLRALRVRLARNGIDVLIAADESIRKASDPVRVAREEAADLVVVKVAPLGGVRRALEIVEACGLPAVVSSALDTSVGIAAGIALAAALPTLDHACGLGTVELLAADVARPSLVPVGGLIAVGPAEVDPELVDRAAAAPDRVAWWHDRVVACHRALEATLQRPGAVSTY